MQTIVATVVVVEADQVGKVANRQRMVIRKTVDVVDTTEVEARVVLVMVVVVTLAV